MRDAAGNQDWRSRLKSKSEGWPLWETEAPCVALIAQGGSPFQKIANPGVDKIASGPLRPPSPEVWTPWDCSCGCPSASSRDAPPPLLPLPGHPRRRRFLPRGTGPYVAGAVAITNAVSKYLHVWGTVEVVHLTHTNLLDVTVTVSRWEKKN